MNVNVAALAATYIDEILNDQKELGYTGDVSLDVRLEAQRHAEAALKTLVHITERSNTGAIAA